MAGDLPFARPVGRCAPSSVLAGAGRPSRAVLDIEALGLLLIVLYVIDAV
jgi:hypothetical protein